jgi:hypothetical protein
MPSLRELQSAFAQAMFRSPGALLLEAVAGDERLDARQRLAIYQNNVFGNYRSALGDVYPVVRRLVGEDFFRHAADAFATEERSTSGDLHDFGEAFAVFLARYRAARDLVYLADVAHLEWAVHRVFHAAEALALPIDALATVSPERLPDLRFSLSPAVRLVASRYPVVRIWEVNQPEFDGDQTVNLDQGGDWALVARRSHAVEVQRLRCDEFTMLAALDSGQRLAQAFGEATAADADFDLEAFLLRHVPAGTLASLHIA